MMSQRRFLGPAVAITPCCRKLECRAVQKEVVEATKVHNAADAACVVCDAALWCLLGMVGIVW